MDRSSVVTLVKRTFTTDGIGQKIPVETTRDVFCSVNSVSQSEWFEAGRNGLKAEYRVNMFDPEYEGEEIVVFGGVRYGVYRTYRRNSEVIELYLERKAGV